MKTHKELKQEIENNQQLQTKIRTLLKKHKQGLKTKLSLAKFNQPTMFLIRRNQKVEFYEAGTQNQLTKGKFYFKDSDGTDRDVKLDDSYLHTVDYGDDTFKTYLMHEDWAFPMPPKPLIEARAFKNAINNAMSAEMKWKAEEKKATAKLIWAAVGFVAVAIGGFILYKMLAPPPAPTQIIAVMNTTANLVQTTPI